MCEFLKYKKANFKMLLGRKNGHKYPNDKLAIVLFKKVGEVSKLT
jgi:hypothetical protein